ncbi:cytochrome P450 4C1-like [Tribolium madens]|uniref:cytochrome P450 4C1-like n=1 Tax=Tribolium madens TaxID=41895 RepID=UPI001CF7299E|nr:cytochrome P450 4C1-like [Tribolium madens]XP_044263330.1 cytochrome P450 4C1-like [Tribolium madens]
MDFTLILLLTCFTIGLINFCKWLKNRKRIWDAIEPIGGEKWYPLIGTCLELAQTKRKDFYDVYCARNVKYGPFFRTWMGFIPAIHVMKPDHVERILSSTVNLTKGDNYRFVVPWLGEGLITGSNHKKWRVHRKLITPTFHFSILDNMMEVMTEKGQFLAEQLAAKANGQFFNIYPFLTLCELDIICETAMGVEVNAMKHSESEYVRSVYGIADIMLYRMFHPYLHPDFIFNLSSKGRQHNKYLSILHGFTRKVIQERKEKLTSGRDVVQELSEEDKLLGKKKRLAFLDLLLEANKNSEGGLTDEEIREEVDTFMFAGHDTSTVTVGWTLFTLSNYPEYQEKVYQELDEIFQGEERPITPQDVLKMQYLDKVIKETQRLIPVVPVIARTLDQDLEIGGRTIPAGVMVVIHLARLHKDPEQFPDPDRFDPDRFLPENVSKRHPYSFVPFSAGPRNCLGQKFALRNTKVLLASILRKYKVRAEKKIHEMKYNIEIVLRPQEGLNVALELRRT